MTVALAVRASSTMPRSAPPLIRLRPAPNLEPPFEDDVERQPPDPPAAPPGAGVEVELPLDWSGGHRPPATGTAGAAPLSPAKLAAHRYLALCLEVLGGFRPLSHLRALTST